MAFQSLAFKLICSQPLHPDKGFEWINGRQLLHSTSCCDSKEMCFHHFPCCIAFSNLEYPLGTLQRSFFKPQVRRQWPAFKHGRWLRESSKKQVTSVFLGSEVGEFCLQYSFTAADAKLADFFCRDTFVGPLRITLLKSLCIWSHRVVIFFITSPFWPSRYLLSNQFSFFY